MEEIYENEALGVLLTKYKKKQITSQEKSKLIEELLVEQADFVDTKFINKLLMICDLNMKTTLWIDEDNIAMLFIRKYNILKTPIEKVLKILSKTDLDYQNKRGESVIYLLLKEDVPISFKNLLPFLQQINLNQQDNTRIPIMYHILKKENYFDKIQMIQLWNQCNNDTQQNTFHKLVVDKVLKSIYFLIYDCQFQPDSETNQWLNNMKSIDILQMIEKRDVLWNLQKNMLDDTKKTSKQVKL